MSKRGFVDVLYSSPMGRLALKGIMYSGILKPVGKFMHAGASKCLIKKFIKNNHIDMTEYKGQTYDSFQAFFSRKRENASFCEEENTLISPCDGLLSVFPIHEDSRFYIKESIYKVSDLIPNEKIAKHFHGGDCLIFRLRATDYHRYMYVDDALQGKNHYIEGLLHSVQPIACDTYPVYKQNRRVWTLLKTKHFKTIAQIEVGALLVGGIVNHHENKEVKKGQEMGYFDLAGSTIVLLLQKGAMELDEKYQLAYDGGIELPVHQGDAIGYKK